MARSIPIIPTVLLTYRLTFSNFLYALKIAWIWFALAAFLFYATATTLNVTIADLINALLNSGTTSAFVEANYGPLTLMFVTFFLVFCMGWASIAVLWHRYLLDGEEKTGLPAELGTRMFAYLRRFITIIVIVAIAMIGVALVYAPISVALLQPFMTEVDGQPTITFSAPALIVQLALSLVLYGIVGTIFTRLALSLPAIALDNPTFSVGEGLRAGAGNNGRLFLVHILMFLPVVLLELLFSPSNPVSLMPSFLEGSITLSLLGFAIYLFVTLLGVTLLSVLYRYLVQEVPYEQVF